MSRPIMDTENGMRHPENETEPSIHSTSVTISISGSEKDGPIPLASLLVTLHHVAAHGRSHFQKTGNNWLCRHGLQ